MAQAMMFSIPDHVNLIFHNHTDVKCSREQIRKQYKLWAEAAERHHVDCVYAVIEALTVLSGIHLSGRLT